MNRIHLNTIASCCFYFAGLSLSLAPLAQAQTASDATHLVTTPVDKAKTVTLHGNVRREASPLNDRGKVDGSLAMDHLLLQLNRPGDREAELTALIEELYRPGSPDFHKWLTAKELGRLEQRLLTRNRQLV